MGPALAARPAWKYRRDLGVGDEALPALLVPVEDHPDPVLLVGIAEDASHPWTRAAFRFSRRLRSRRRSRKRSKWGGSRARATLSLPSPVCLLVPVVRGCVSAPEQDKAHDEEGRDRDTDADKGKGRQGEHRSGATESDCWCPFNPLPLHSGDFGQRDESRRGFQPSPATGRPTAGFLQLASSSHPAQARHGITVRLDVGGRDSCGTTAPSPGPRESRFLAILSDYAQPLLMPFQTAIVHRDEPCPVRVTSRPE